MKFLHRFAAATRPAAIRLANRLAYVALRLLLRKPRPGRNVVILGDYQSFELLLRHPLLDSYKIVLVATRRYHFAKLFPRDFRRLSALLIVPDYSDEQREILLGRLRPFAPEAVLIQAGEFIVPMCNFLNRELGLRGNSEFASQASLSKVDMRRALRAGAVETIRFAEISSPSDIKDIDFWPVVLKPSVSTGGLGVHMATSEAEALEALETATNRARKTEFGSRQAILAEEYVVGRQFDVEGVVRDGKASIVCIVEEYYEEFLPQFDHCWFLFNLPIPDDVRSRIHDTVQRSLQAAGIAVGAYHCELRLDKGGNVRVLEFSNRMGGGFETKMTDATGVDIVAEYLSAMLDLPSAAANRRDKYLLERYCRTLEEVEQWQQYCAANGVDLETRYRNFRDFKAVLLASTSDWSTMKSLMSDLLNHDVESFPAMD